MTFDNLFDNWNRLTLVTDGNASVTKGKTLMTKGKTLVVSDQKKNLGRGRPW